MRQHALRTSLIINIITWHVLSLQCQLPCLKCASNHPSTCLNCAQNFYLSSTRCLTCSNGCRQYQNQSSCTICNDSYFLGNSICKKCIDNCLKCQNNGKCQICARQYFMSLNQGQCIKCQDNCLECLNEKSCTTCLSGYYQKSSQCISCGPDCLTCRDNQDCQTCAQNFYVSTAISSNQTCLICPDMCSNCKIYMNCILCGTTLICDKTCLSFYFINKQCEFTENKSYTLLILITISSFFFLCIALIAFMRYRRRRSRLSESYFSQSRAQIETSLQSSSQRLDLAWSKHGGQELDFLSECSVCLEKGVNVCISCKHMYHMACFLLWVQKNQSCPNCRNSIVQLIRIYCRTCHRHFVEKDIKNCKEMRFRNAFDLCDYCRYI